MFEGAFSPFHWLLVLAIAMIFFGPKKLPELGKGLGAAIRNFKDGLNGGLAGGDKPADATKDDAATKA